MLILFIFGPPSWYFLSFIYCLLFRIAFFMLELGYIVCLWCLLENLEEILVGVNSYLKNEPFVLPYSP